MNPHNHELPVAHEIESPSVVGDVPIAQPIGTFVAVESAPRRQSARGLKKLAHNTPRLLLYIAVFLLLGALAIPAVLINRRIGRFEKTFLCVSGVLQTLVSVAVLVGCIVWIVVVIRRVMAGDADAANPFGF